eukprot:m.270389 g.270389  ORF g.270389 m.270389 type:complete len:1312 (-) comp15680_c1_seq2:1830-5765(-)
MGMYTMVTGTVPVFHFWQLFATGLVFVCLSCLCISMPQATVGENPSILQWQPTPVFPAGPGVRWSHTINSNARPDLGGPSGDRVFVFAGKTLNPSFNAMTLYDTGSLWEFHLDNGSFVMFSDGKGYERASQVAQIMTEESGDSYLISFGGAKHLLEGDASSTIIDELMQDHQLPGNDGHAAFIGQRQLKPTVTLLGDTIAYCFNNLTWQTRQSEASPPPRVYSVDSLLNQGSLWVVFGGMSTESCKSNTTAKQCVVSADEESVALDDLWGYDLPSRTWFQIPSNNTPIPRYSHAGVTLMDSWFCITGGSDAAFPVGSSNPQNAPLADESLWCIDLAGVTPTNITTNTWQEFPHNNANFTARNLQAQATSLNETHFILMGGRVAMSTLRIQSLVFDWNTKAWSAMPVSLSQTRASSRVGQAATRVSNYVVSHGGHNMLGFFSSLFTYFPYSNVWSEAYLMTQPSSRSSFCTTQLGSFMYIYGGFDGEMVTAEFWRLDLQSGQWALLSAQAEPGPRAMCSITATGENVALFGGIGVSEELNTLWTYHTAQKTWSPCKTPGPSARYDAAIAYVPPLPGSPHKKGSLIVFAGKAQLDPGAIVETDYALLSDTWVLDIGGETWTNLTSKMPAPLSEQPVPRSGHGLVASPMSTTDEAKEYSTVALVMGGGISVVNATPGEPFDIHNPTFQRYILHDTWVLGGLYSDSPRWLDVTVPSDKKQPGRRVFFGMCWVPPPSPDSAKLYEPLSFGRMIVQGGAAELPPLNTQTVWNLRSIGDTWMGTLTLPFDQVEQLNTHPNSSELQVKLEYFDLHTTLSNYSQHDIFVYEESLYTVGGSSQQSLTGASGSSNVANLTLACAAGYWSTDFVRDGCHKCPIGFYSSTPGSHVCTKCPRNTTTQELISTSIQDCNICSEEDGPICIKGTCSISSDGAFVWSCKCDGWFLDNRCRYNGAIIVSATLVGLILVVALPLLAFRRQQRRLRYAKVNVEETAKLLQERSDQLAELERAWEIGRDEIQLIERIDGESPGYFGQVWRAQFNDLPVAVKMLKDSVVELDESAQSDFVAEIRFMRTLRHRNIVYFCGAGCLGCNPFLVTEFMERGALTTILADKELELPLLRRLRFLSDAACGMAFLHELRPPRIHRDLKSGNLLVTSNWVTKVADFGTSRLVQSLKEDQQAMTTRSTAPSHEQLDFTMTMGVGTLLWTAPEVHEGREYSLPADVYSFSMVMHEVATRTLPFSDLPTAWAVRNAVCDGIRPDIPLNMPDKFNKLMEQCWSHEPEERPTFRVAYDAIMALEQRIEQEAQEQNVRKHSTASVV